MRCVAGLEIYTRIDNLRRKRNQIAHGSIGLVYYGDHNYMRILPPMFSIHDIEDSEITPNNLPGLSINDMMFFPILETEIK